MTWIKIAPYSSFGPRRRDTLLGSGFEPSALFRPETTHRQCEIRKNRRNRSTLKCPAAFPFRGTNRNRQSWRH